MKSELAARLRKYFSAAIAHRFPSFKLLSTAQVPQGCRVYQREASSRISAFVVLAISPNVDRFTVELAWSNKGRFPALLLPMQPVPSPRHNKLQADEPRDGEYRF